MSTPLIRTLRASYPHATIVYVVGAYSAGVLAHNPHIDEVMSFDEHIFYAKRWKDIIQLLRRLRRLRADLGFVLDKHLLAVLFAWAAGICFRVGFNRAHEGDSLSVAVAYGSVRHEIEYNLDLLRKMSSTRSLSTHMEVFPTKSDEGHVAEFIRSLQVSGRSLVGMSVGAAENPGQRLHLKRWPIHHYIQLIKLLHLHFPTVQILLFGGRNDIAVNEYVLHRTQAKPINVAGKTSILQSILLMGRCRLFITHDSGPMHMAAAARTPVLSLFGPVHPGRVAPLGSLHRYLWKPDAEGALCYDMYGRFPAAVDVLPCMQELSPQEVASEAVRMMTR